MSKQLKINKENAITFLIYCYFGSVEDPLLASIDRAYLDMQTHTLSGKQEVLFAGRKKGTEILHDAIENIQTALSFDEWHKDTARKLKEGNPILSYGQIQKWINMSIKYVYTLKLLGVENISDYFIPANSESLHPALDSYVLNAIGEKNTWSTIADYDVYDTIRKKMTFAEEYVHWPQYAHNAGIKRNGDARTPEKGTYKRYIWDTKGYSFAANNRRNKTMKVKFKGIDGLYVVGECGVVDLDAYEDQETAVENRDYGKFEKKAFYWTIYDQIILPIRNAVGVDPDHSIRLLFIEDDGDKIVIHYNIDDYDESYCEIQGVANMALEDVMKVVYEDFCGMRNALPEGEALKEAITWDKNRSVNIPDDYLERLKKDVFYASWEIEYTMMGIDKLILSESPKVDDNALEELAESIREHGVVEPIRVDASLNIISGKRRWMAAKIAGLKEVPVVRRAYK